MFQHFLRYVRQENWFLLLQCLCRRANPRNLGANSDGGSVRCSIKLEKMQSFSIAVQKIQVGSMERRRCWTKRRAGCGGRLLPSAARHLPKQIGASSDTLGRKWG